jgi:hypothetical protein
MTSPANRSLPAGKDSIRGELALSRCPRRVKRRQAVAFRRCPLFPQRQTSIDAPVMSLRCQNQTNCAVPKWVRYSITSLARNAAKEASAPMQTTSLF